MKYRKITFKIPPLLIPCPDETYTMEKGKLKVKSEEDYSNMLLDKRKIKKMNKKNG